MKKKSLVDMDSLFSNEEKFESQSNEAGAKEISNASQARKMITVTKAIYKETYETSFEELFSGFDELKAITFSVSLTQVKNVVRYFKTAEIIISKNQITKPLATLMATKTVVGNRIAGDSYLKKRVVNENTLHFYATIHSHAKIYLMKAEDGRTRTIMTSANFSVRAWSGEQFENYIVLDEQEAYYDALKVWNYIKNERSTDNIIVNASQIDDIENMKIFSNVIQTHEPIVIQEQPRTEEEKEENAYCFAVDEAAKKAAELLEKSSFKPNKDGKILITAVRCEKLLETVKKEKLKDSLDLSKKRNPQFFLNRENRTACFDNDEWNLKPKREEIESDIKTLLNYFASTSEFTRNVTDLRCAYWKIIIYMFASPFFAEMRRLYRQSTSLNSCGRLFPIWMVIFGAKDAGKSSIVSFTQKLMFGCDLYPLSGNDAKIDAARAWKYETKGIPLLIDEIAPKPFSNIKTLIKDEQYFFEDNAKNHGVYIFTTNDIKSIAADILKRTIFISLKNQLPSDKAVKADKHVLSLKKCAGNALYKEYLRKMFDEVDTLEKGIIENTQKEGWFPDIFKASSKVLRQIFAEHGMPVPTELKNYEWKDYMGEVATSRNAVMLLEEYFQAHSDSFKIVENEDRMRIDFSEYEDKTKKEIIKLLKEELPVSAECNIVGFEVFVKYSAVCKFTLTKFKRNKGIFDKIQNFLKDSALVKSL